MQAILFTLAFLATTVLAEVPSYIHVCGRRDPNLDRCVQNSVEGLRGKLRAGMPELDAPSIEPMILKEVKLADVQNFRAVAQNLKIYGLSNFNVKKLHVDLEKKRIDLELVFDKLKLNADYDVNAKIVIPVAGRGPIDIRTDAVTAKVTLKYQLVNHKGQTYIYFPSMTTKLTITDYTSHFQPKEGPNSALATGINSALSSSRQEIIETITPNLESAISETILQLTNKITKHFTYDELFPDRA